MQKIVVRYSSDGGYECGCYDHVLCFNYESPEAWVVHFEELLKERKKQIKETEEAYRKWIKRQPPHTMVVGGHVLFDKKHKGAEEKYALWLGQQPQYPQRDFIFCGHNFYIEDFCVGDDLTLPEVYELNEWFEKCVADM